MIAVGQAYLLAGENIPVTSQGSPMSLVQLTVANNVPLWLEYAVVTCATINQNDGRLVIAKHTAGGTGSAGTLTPKNKSPAGPAASATVNYALTTVGTGGGTYDPLLWNVVTPAEWDYMPSGLLCVPGEFLCIDLLVGLGGPFNFSFKIEFTEAK